MLPRILLAVVAGWIQRHLQLVISYLIEETRILKAQLDPNRLRLTDTERRRLAALGHPLGRKRLKGVPTLATSETLMRWCKRLIAQKFDGSRHRQQRARPRVTEVIEQLMVWMAKEKATWSYRSAQAYQIIAPEPGLGSHSGPVRRRERFGGLLRYDYPDAA